jgi:AhpD family alkylhydroperoxidase
MSASFEQSKSSANDNQNVVSSFHARRSRQNERILQEDFLNFKRFFALDHQAYTAGALDSKTKEMLGLVASMVLRCNDCILYHLDRCVAEGCTRGELNEAMNVALIVGGSIVIPHLRFAFDCLDELLPHQ